eukprot:363531-Chlamydomonas_euryale.AAC.8
MDLAGMKIEGCGAESGVSWVLPASWWPGRREWREDMQLGVESRIKRGGAESGVSCGPAGRWAASKDWREEVQLGAEGGVGGGAGGLAGRETVRTEMGGGDSCLELRLLKDLAAHWDIRTHCKMGC